MQERLGAIGEICRQVYKQDLLGVAAFGSYGRGVARPDSDIDLLLIVDRQPAERTAAMRTFAAVEAAFGRWWQEQGQDHPAPSLSPVFRNRDQLEDGFALLLDMVEDAIVLDDPLHLIEDRLRRLKARLQELGAKRIPYKGAWYWDLKPDFQPGDVVEL
ncbi:MAG: nucleotidyltransferase domain-containing protein [Sulfobacillus sp.]